MSILSELKDRLRGPLAKLDKQPEPLLEMVRRSQDSKFGDYQANFAMPLGKQLGRSPREIAAEIAEQLHVEDFCEPPEVAGPGFVNFRLKDEWLAERLSAAVTDPRLGVPSVETPKTYVVDYSAPNVAKPMHVGHIRSTVIGDALCRMLRFLGHAVTSDNHIGDWGTQFGMILYGYRNFRDDAAYQKAPVQELARLYRLVRRLIDYHDGKALLPGLREKLRQQEDALAVERAAAGDDLSLPAGETAGKHPPLPAGERAGNHPPLTSGERAGNYPPLPSGERAGVRGPSSAAPKKAAKNLRRAEGDLAQTRDEIESLEASLAAVDADPQLSALAADHAEVGAAVLAETAKLHAGDEDNRRLWREFSPHCRDEIQRVYARLNVTFDHTLGESFYQDRLAATVQDLIDRGIAQESQGAVCVFLEGQPAPMLVRKQDGAFLYATTDLATIEYRLETWRPDAILYVVDHRQSMHFEHLFATVRRMGVTDVELQHVSFGTVLGSDGRPFRTRSGDTVGLEGLLDEAVRRAGKIVADNDDAKPGGPELSPDERVRIAERVGIAALKYADLSQNRTSDYVFSYDKMLAMNGNTATYMQYAYARVRSIFAKGNVNVEALRASGAAILLGTPAERALGLEVLRFGEALDLALLDYRPNQLTAYLFELAGCYSTFFENCPVLKAETDALRASRLLLCDLTARVLHKGLELLGIEVVEKM